MLGQPTRGVARAAYHGYLALLLYLSVLPVAARLANCSSFATNGTAASEFSYYRFYDFRNLPIDTWDSVQEAADPNNVTAGASTSDMSWQLDWQRRNDIRDPARGTQVLPIDYQAEKVAPRNVTGSSEAGDITALGLLSSRENDAMHQSSGIDFNEDAILYLSLRLYARISGAPGACAAFFTYENDTQEADMEFLTRDQDELVGFNTQPTYDIHGNYINGSHYNMSLPHDLTREEWALYRMDWVADQVVWYIDGVEMGSTTVNVPVVPSHLYITMWGNGGTWTGNMTLGESALLEIQWIEVAYNLSGASPVTNSSYGICDLDSQGSWDPLVFSAPHDTSAAARTGMSVFVTCLSIILALQHFY